MPRVVGVIGISSGEVSRHASFYDELTQVDRPDNVVVSHAVGLYVNKNRDQLAEHALKLGADWIWYVDDDHCFHQDTLTKLLAHDVDIVSGLYVRRVAPFQPVFYRDEDQDGDPIKPYFRSTDKGLMPVLAVGAGCLLVKTKVHRELGPPYWRFSENRRGEMNGEDVDFCYRARAKGFTVWCDLNTPIGHRISAVAYPHQDGPGNWQLKLIDANGHMIVSGKAATS